MIIFLDSGTLSQITNPKFPPATLEILSWARTMRLSGHRIQVLAIADYEVRRELERLNKRQNLNKLDSWNNEYLPLTKSAIKLACKLWAQAHNTGAPTADPKEIVGDVLIAAQVIDLGFASSDTIIATTNVGHLSRFTRCDLWTNIQP